MSDHKDILNPAQLAELSRRVRWMALVLALVVLGSLFYGVTQERWAGWLEDSQDVPGGVVMADLPEAESIPDDWVENGIHMRSGLKVDDGLDAMKSNCLSCHSGHLIAQNRLTRKGWKDLIVWMQQTQNLWDLGESEGTILEYLERNYAPEEKARRANLKDVEWYVLD